MSEAEKKKFKEMSFDEILEYSMEKNKELMKRLAKK